MNITKTCANCSGILFPNANGEVPGIGKYYVGENCPDKSIFEGLQLLFKSRQFFSRVELDEKRNDVRVCVPCAAQFQNVMNCYTEFLRSSEPGSYVATLQKEVSQFFKSCHDIPILCNTSKSKPQKAQRSASNNAISIIRSTSLETMPIITSIFSETKESNTNLQSAQPKIATGDYTVFQGDKNMESNVSNIQNEVSRGHKSQLILDNTWTRKPRICRPRPPTFLIPSRFQSVSVMRTLPSSQTVSIARESNTDVQFSEPEIITPDSVVQHEGDLTFNDENSEINLNNLDSSSKDPLLIPINSRTVISPQFTTKSLTVAVSASSGTVPNKQPAGRRKQKLENRRGVTPVTAASPRRRYRRGPPDEIRPFVCLSCNFAVKSQALLNKHNRIKHGAPYVRPPYLKNKIELTEEQKAVVDFSKFPCDELDCKEVTFGSFQEWVLHQENDHKLNTGYRDDLEKLGELIPKYKKIRPCPICGRKCDTATRVIRHLKIVHFKDRKGECHCDVCGKPLSTEFALAHHMKVMHSETPVTRDFLCTYCGDSFAMKGALKLHEETHLEIIQEKRRKYGCNVCEKRFVSKSRLRDHKFTHSEERNFACDQCNATFKVENILKNHKSRMHCNNQQVILDEVCDLCGKKFVSKTRVKEHLISHHKMDKEEARILAKIKRRSLFRVLPNGDRIFKEQTRTTKPKTCYICNRTYVRRDNLYTHLMSVHGKSEQEAKDITGFETIRNLVPGPGKSRKKRNLKSLPEECIGSGNKSSNRISGDEYCDRVDDNDDEESGEDEYLNL